MFMKSTTDIIQLDNPGQNKALQSYGVFHVKIEDATY
jgi:hypothetical protein